MRNERAISQKKKKRKKKVYREKWEIFGGKKSQKESLEGSRDLLSIWITI